MTATDCGVRPAVERRLAAVARCAADRPDGRLGTWSRHTVGHRVENMTTHALDRYEGRLDDGTPWSVIAKTLHPASESPSFAMVPEQLRASVLAALNWLDEPRVYRSDLAARLPGQLRMPRVHAIDESTDRITIWMEDVADAGSWDPARYRRTAAALGRVGGALRERTGVAELGLGHRAIGDMFFDKVIHHDLPIQASDEFWGQPAVAAAVDEDHRGDLFELARRMPQLIARLEELPRGVCHGDAAPDNFREPGDGSIVAIDWSYANVGALGSDLGQLLAGRFESGAADVGDLEDVADAVFDGYREGLAMEGADIEPEAVELAWATHLAIRSVFSALNVDHRPDLGADARAQLVRRRAAVARFGIDLAMRHA